MGKGSKRRPCLMSNDEADLRWALARGEINREHYDREMKIIKDKKNEPKL